MRFSPLSSTQLFFIVLSSYFFFASGYVDCVDAVPSMETARSLIERGRLDAHGPELPGNFFGASPDGLRYSLMGLVMPTLYTVPMALSHGLAPRGLEERFFQFFVSLVNCFVTALLITLVYSYLLWRGRPPSVAIGFALVLAFGTLLFAYSKTSHRESIQALAIFGTFVFLTPEAEIRFRRAFWYAGFFAALGILTKEAFVLVMVPAMGYAIYRTVPCPYAVRRLIAFFSPLALAGLLWAAYQKKAWGAALRFGYDNAVFGGAGDGSPGRNWSTPLWKGISAQWFSWDTSLFLHNPVLFLVPGYLVWKAARKKIDALDLAVLTAFAIQTLFYARWYTPIGKEALGPRFLVMLLPLAIFLLKDFSPRSHLPGRWRWAGTLLLVWSLGLGLVSASVKMQQYWTLKHRAATPLTMPHWAANVVFFVHKLGGSDESYDLSRFGAHEPARVSLRDAESLVGFNLWWMHLIRIRPVYSKLTALNGPIS